MVHLELMLVVNPTRCFSNILLELNKDLGYISKESQKRIQYCEGFCHLLSSIHSYFPKELLLDSSVILH